MKVRLRVQLTGTRNGEDWPRPGTIVDLPEDEADHLFALQVAERPDAAPTTTVRLVEVA